MKNGFIACGLLSVICFLFALLFTILKGKAAIFVSQYMAVGAFALFFIVFIKDIHLDEDKAFGKYKK